MVSYITWSDNNPLKEKKAPGEWSLPFLFSPLLQYRYSDCTGKGRSISVKVIYFNPWTEERAQRNILLQAYLGEINLDGTGVPSTERPQVLLDFWGPHSSLASRRKACRLDLSSRWPYQKPMPAKQTSVYYTTQDKHMCTFTGSNERCQLEPSSLTWIAYLENAQASVRSFGLYCEFEECPPASNMKND